MKLFPLILTIIASVSSTTSYALEITPKAQMTLANTVPAQGEQGWKLLFDGMVSGKISHSFQSHQLDTGAHLRLRLINNIASRPGAAGRLGDPCLECSENQRSPVSPTTGLAAHGPPLNHELRFIPELARIWLSGPWGEAYAGMDVGAAELLDARPRRIFSEIGSFSGSLDPSGLDGVRSSNDISGTSPKIGYASPRILGFKAGLSWSPGNPSGIQRFLPKDDPLHASTDLHHIVELGLSFARRFYNTGMRIRVALTYSTAQNQSPHTEYGQYHAVGTGAELEYRDWHYALRWLHSNNALIAGNGDYNAIETAISRQAGPWRFGIEFGWASDQMIGMNSLTYSIGSTYEINEFFQLGLAFVSGQASLGRENTPDQKLEGSGPVLEMRLKL